MGLVTIIGLAAKNAILIIEFAKDLHEQGRSLKEAAIEAARLRFRPIVMTSVAFILGVVPLVIATGAGATSQRAIGTGVLGGMLSATFLGVFRAGVLRLDAVAGQGPQVQGGRGRGHGGQGMKFMSVFSMLNASDAGGFAMAAVLSALAWRRCAPAGMR